MTERRPATTIGELDIYLSNLQAGLVEMRDTLRNMATKDDIRQITASLVTFATKEELRAAEARLREDSVPSVAKRFGNGMVLAAATLTAVMAMAGAAITLLRWFDGLPK